MKNETQQAQRAAYKALKAAARSLNDELELAQIHELYAGRLLRERAAVQTAMKALHPLIVNER